MIRYQINLRATLILAVLSLASAIGLYILWGYQENRVLKTALKQIRAFQEAASKTDDLDQQSRNNELALRHLILYLDCRPDDADGLEIEAQILEGINANRAAWVYEHLLRVEPAGLRARRARRRLAEIYTVLSDNYRRGQLVRLMPETTSQHDKYLTAETHAYQLLKENAEANPPVDDAEAHRLHAMALEGQIIPNDTSRKVDVYVGGRLVKQKTLEQATLLEYQTALALDPGDMQAAQRLAELYRKSLNIDAAMEVLDALRKSRPDSIEVRGLRRDFFTKIGDFDAAVAELDEAVLLDPENLGIILTAAENALRMDDSGDTIEPRFWLDQVPGSLRNDPRVLLVLGLVEYTERKYEAAIATWRRGLEQSPVANAGLTQWLALVLLEMGRDDEAAMLVQQYRRLVSDTDPVLRLLEGMQDAHAGRFSPAIARLEGVRDRLPEFFQTPVHLILAYCQERQGNALEAAKIYRAARRLNPKSPRLREALGRLLRTTRPEEAASEFQDVLEYHPNQPALLLNLASARLEQQKMLPRERRNWAAFDADFNRAAVVGAIVSGLGVGGSDFDVDSNRAAVLAPISLALVLLKAERLAADGRPEEAISLLRKAVAQMPTSLELTSRLADYQLRQGRGDQALELLVQAADPKAVGDRGALRLQRAQVLNSMGRGREARTVLVREVDRLSPADRDEIWRYLMLLCKRQGDPAVARATYGEWVRLLPDDPKPKLALLEMDIEANDQGAIRAWPARPSRRPGPDQGDFFWQLEQARQRLMEAKEATNEKQRRALLKKAGVLVESALHDFRIDSVALLIKGQILEAEGAGEKAVEFYDQASARGNAHASLLVVDLLTRLGRKQELEKRWRKDKTNQLAELVARSFLNHGDKKEALRMARQTLKENSGSQSWQVAMLESLGKAEEAEAGLRKSVEDQPGKLEPWLALIRFQARPRAPKTAVEIDRRVKVEETLEEIRPLLQDGWRPELLEAECRFAAADWAAAGRAFDVALNHYPQVAEVRAAAARYGARKGRLNAADACLSHLKAEANIAKFKPLLKDGWRPELFEAECRFAAADWPAADQAFDTAVKRYPNARDVRAAAARYHEQKGRLDAAEARLRQLEAELSLAELKPFLMDTMPELLEAECRFAAADWPEAEQAFDAALKRYPQVAEVQTAAARYHEQKGRLEAAEARQTHLEAEVSIAATKQRVKYQWPELLEGICRLAAAELSAADLSFDAAVKAYPETRDVQAAAAQYYEQRRAARRGRGVPEADPQEQPRRSGRRAGACHRAREPGRPARRLEAGHQVTRPRGPRDQHAR